ncbi:MAG TPA: phosphatase PAP2 family protein [Candidatus Binataceae bacterium]|nr:phosphatase PAP2 family protein [Candidatus Binataceae bacterium]
MAVSDLKWTINNLEADAEDIATSPLHIPDLFKSDGLLRRPEFYYTLLGAGVIFGGAFALDQTVRARVRGMSNSAANDLETAGNVFSYGVPAAVYLYGLGIEDERMRRNVITGYEAAGVASLITIGLKDAFGRARPRASQHSHTNWFEGGQSFPSGDATPVFALACATSEAFDNRWYVALPAYAGALSVGFGRMGHDAHWLSDIAGAALLGVGTTELMLWMHRQHDLNPSRYRIFAAPAPSSSGAQAMASGGIGIEFSW